ncbi:MAG: hypothetical protein QNK89_10640 [Lacinutrix sp.]|uniref:hypothetical protein n=1 Tax=Lacinutrix sp. TaxID=1937692 RepID=UPI0030A0511E
MIKDLLLTPFQKFIKLESFAKAFKKNTQDSLIWKYSNEPNEKYNTIFRATKEKALIWALN